MRDPEPPSLRSLTSIMTSPTPQPLETDGPANGSQVPPTQTTESPYFIYWVLHSTSQVLGPMFPCLPTPLHTHTHWVLDLHVLTTGSPTTQLMNPETPTIGAHIPISIYPAPSSLRHQIQCLHTALDPRSPTPPADPRPPCFNPWISKLGHWILDIKKPQPPAPDSAMPRPWGPHYWIPDPLIPATGFLNSFTSTLGPRSLFFICQIPTFQPLHLQPPTHQIPDPQALTHWILAPKATIMKAQW